MPKHYLLRAVSDILRERPMSSGEAIKAGWSMGPFYPTDDICFTKDFEIKEWDAALVRKTWDNHAHSGSEYISVTRGTLTLICGEHKSDTKPPVETERVDIIAGRSVVLRPGLWRRFDCTQDVAGVSIRGLTERVMGGVDREELRRRYDAHTEHWKHTDQIRQMLLYNFLMTGTVLVAAWSLLYSQPTKSPSMLLLLMLLSVLGSISFSAVVFRGSSRNWLLRDV